MVRHNRRTQYGLVILGILLALASLEGLLRLYFSLAVDPHTRGLAQEVNLLGIDPTVPDARLGFRLNSMYRGIDARGWRNDSALKQADIVALGDSFTYGVTVSTEEAWPQRLGAILHRTVYQMAVPGYGPGQYLLLFDEAAALRPKVIIATLYFGNDFIDAYGIAYHAGAVKNTAPDALIESFKSSDLKVRQPIRRAEAIDPSLLRSDYVDCQHPRPVPDAHLQTVHDILAAPPLAPLASSTHGAARQPQERNSPDAFLARVSVLYRIVSSRAGRVWRRLRPFASVRDYGSPICVHYRDRQLITIFTPAYRLLTLDRTDPRVVEGERLSWMMMDALAQRCRRAGIRFYVVLLPTKEAVFRARAYGAYHNEPYLRVQWEAEEAARSRALEFFKQRGVEAIDTLPAQKAVVASGVNPYEDDANGHPSRAGFDAIARAIAERLQRDGFALPH
jgi:hypothetical protein